jgi:hypothetical protein
LPNNLGNLKITGESGEIRKVINVASLPAHIIITGNGAAKVIHLPSVGGSAFSLLSADGGAYVHHLGLFGGNGNLRLSASGQYNVLHLGKFSGLGNLKLTGIGGGSWVVKNAAGQTGRGLLSATGGAVVRHMGFVGGTGNLGHTGTGATTLVSSTPATSNYAQNVAQNVSSTSVSWAATTTSGSTLVVGIYLSGTTLSTMPTNWTIIKTATSGTANTYLLYKPNSAAISSVTFNFVGTASNLQWISCEVKNVQAASLDVSQSAASAPATTVSTGTTASTGHSNEIAIAFTSTSSSTAPTGWTNSFSPVVSFWSGLSVYNILLTKTGIGSGVTINTSATVPSGLCHGTVATFF